MTKAELLADIANGRTVAERLPLYNAAMNLGLLSYQEIKTVVEEAEPTRPVAKKTATKKTTSPRRKTT